VLFTPENNNHELALARLILKNKSFFASPQSEQKPKTEKKIAIFEMGAYRRGEIKTMCDFVQPHITILTAIGQQHLDLFGSQKNIQLGKFEIAEGASDKVFFNADNNLCNELFGHQTITATPIGIKSSSVKKKSAPHQTAFHAFGADFVLPWPGEFFVSNALLALECARELGVKIPQLVSALAQVPPLERAMQITNHPQGFAIIKDLYSANPAGVKAAIKHLATFRGKKIFVGHPLLELGPEAKKIHTQIFHQLAAIKAFVFWTKNDYQKIGQKICSDNWHGSDIKKLQSMLKKLSKDDVILLEGRLPKTFLDTVEFDT
jgi:UDP-N-acetylmuramyl pentapeptide synthase